MKKAQVMNETILRNMIRHQIKNTLTEQPSASGRVATTLGRVEKMAGVKMLKKALGTGGPAQQAAGLHAVVKSISGDNPQTAKLLARALMKKGSDAPDPAPAPTPEVNEKVSASLTSRMGKLDKTQAMKMMRAALRTKPASQQAEFVADLVKNLDLKGNITLLIKKIRQIN
jgi:hypothetical protein